MFSLLLLASCGPDDGVTTAGASLVVSLAVEPGSVSVTTTPDAAGTYQFEAMATFDDGSVAPLEELVSWSLSNSAAGEIDRDGLFTATTRNGAVTTVTANHHGITADAELTVVWEAEQGDDGTDPAAFDGAAVGEVAWLYPPDGVSVPRNVPSLTFMWSEVEGASAYRLRFSTDTTSMTVVTALHRWTVEGQDWGSIAATNAGGQVTVDVRALVGDEVYASPPVTLTVNRLDALGSIYYWSTTDEGIVKVGISDTAGELYFAPRLNASNCVACHVVREDRMGVTYAPSDDVFVTGIVDISAEPTEMTGQDTLGYFNTMNPDGTQMISTGPDGALNLWDTVTGDLIGPIDTGGVKLTQPDWSPDGTMLAAIASEELTGYIGFGDGRLVVATIDEAGNLGPLTELVAGPTSGPDRTNTYYPAWSPDGEWIAFNQAPGSSYDNLDATLYVVSSSGGDPIALDAANQGEGLANSWPHWGPLPDDDVFWITFSSHRAYGDLVTDGRPQIWVAGFHPDRAMDGTDPSDPAFWLPNQDPETKNHSTFWGR